MSNKSRKKPLVSIVIPTFQSSSHISTTIERTAAAMEVSNYEFEILIIDDGSSDNTWGRSTMKQKKSKGFLLPVRSKLWTTCGNAVWA